MQDIVPTFVQCRHVVTSGETSRQRQAPTAQSRSIDISLRRPPRKLCEERRNEATGSSAPQRGNQTASRERLDEGQFGRDVGPVRRFRAHRILCVIKDGPGGVRSGSGSAVRSRRQMRQGVSVASGCQRGAGDGGDRSGHGASRRRLRPARDRCLLRRYAAPSRFRSPLPSNSRLSTPKARARARLGLTLVDH